MDLREIPDDALTAVLRNMPTEQVRTMRTIDRRFGHLGAQVLKHRLLDAILRIHRTYKLNPRFHQLCAQYPKIPPEVVFDTALNLLWRVFEEDFGTVPPYLWTPVSQDSLFAIQYGTGFNTVLAFAEPPGAVQELVEAGLHPRVSDGLVIKFAVLTHNPSLLSRCAALGGYMDRIVAPGLFFAEERSEQAQPLACLIVKSFLRPSVKNLDIDNVLGLLDLVMHYQPEAQHAQDPTDELGRTVLHHLFSPSSYYVNTTGWTQQQNDAYALRVWPLIKHLLHRGLKLKDALDAKGSTIFHLVQPPWGGSIATNILGPLGSPMPSSGIDVRQLGPDRETMGHLLAATGFRAFTLLARLKELGADINHRDRTGSTPLLYVLNYSPWGYTEFAEPSQRGPVDAMRHRLLIEYFTGMIDVGCDPTIPDNSGETALDVVIQFLRIYYKKRIQFGIDSPSLRTQRDLTNNFFEMIKKRFHANVIML